jgi:hypothetical protein
MWHVWERKVFKVLVGKPERKRPLGKTWKDGIRKNIRDIGWGWIGVDSPDSE